MSGSRVFGPGMSRSPSKEFPGGDHMPRTALPVRGGIPHHLQAHLHRLETGAAALGQPVDWLQGLQTDLEAWLSSGNPLEAAALRLVLHPEAGLLSAWLESLPAAPQPCLLVLLPHPLGAQRLDPVVRHKGLMGPWGTDLLGEARRLGAQDALLQWPDGTLAETTIASVAIETEGALLVPPPEGRVASLTESLELPAWAQSRGLRIESAPLHAYMAAAGQLWCMNALRGFWPATLV